MTIFDILNAPQVAPFMYGVAFLFGVSLLEVVTSFIGLSILGEADTDVADIDVGDLDFEAEIDMGLDIADGVDGELDLDVGGGGFFSWLGFGRVPMMVWIVAMIGGFAATGMLVQLVTHAVMGFLWPTLIALLPAVLGGLFIGKFLAEIIGAMVPKTTTTAISADRLGGSSGYISQGTAREGMPATARVKDIFGTTHRVYVVPYPGEEVLLQGTKVVILRDPNTGGYRAMSLDAARRHRS